MSHDSTAAPASHSPSSFASAESAHAPRPVVRLGLVQLQMRPTPDLEAFYEHVEFFIRALSGYEADFVVFPEYVNAPLMAPFRDLSAADSIRKLAALTAEIREFFVRKAVAHQINIVTGSLPLYENGRLGNVVYLCRRDGTWEQQLKIHITPSEVSEWEMTGGDDVRVFDTDRGRVAILICYDVEFPELGRLLADQGVQILFVPFCTDSSSGYDRVRLCARARAIENECYVAVTGSVGNLPNVVNMDFQHARSAVFSPCDFAFPEAGVVKQAVTNTEMVVIADVDLHHLKDLHDKGSVRNLRQRRTDLYEVKSK